MILAGAASFGYYKITEFVKTPVNVQADQLLTIERGTTGSKLAALFEQEKLIDDGKLLPYLLKLKPELNKIKAGTYSLENVKTVQDLLDLLNSGKEVQFNVKWIEGKTFKDWRKDLENAPHLVQTLKDKSNEEIFTLLDLPDVGQNLELKNVEGWLYPDTYNYTPKSTDLELLKRSAERMKKALNKAWNERDEDLPLANPYEMLILASIVEKETGVAAERAKVASVFINRLKAKMKLQTDPTVIYGMGENYSGNIRKKDLETPTPYNTYVIDGLPPTPIAMPSESSLQAVANPEKTDFYYFVADGSGGHKFTRNLNEHNKAVQEYLRWYRNQKMPNKSAEENMKGKFIVIEGLEGAGKSSAHQSVVRVLHELGIQDVVFTREPGGTPLAEKLRHLIKHETEEPVTDKAELLMLYAARVQLVENVIKPALMQGKWVVGDRHDMSSQAYQGGGRQLDPHFMLTLKETVLGDFEPDLTIYLDIDPSVGLARARGRGELDRIEQMDLDFFSPYSSTLFSVSKR